MDAFLTSLTSQAVNYAIRSGLTITTTYAIKQCTRLLDSTPASTCPQQHDELQQLQSRLETKIRIISPAIDMIELIAARGNTSLESAVKLTRAIRMEIQKLGMKLGDAADSEQATRKGQVVVRKAKSKEDMAMDLQAIISAIKALLVRIEDAIPLINLAITTSGVNLSTTLSRTISPSRFLQAATFLRAADTNYTLHPGLRQQVGPTYTLSLYMLFAGHARWINGDIGGTDVRETTWKEVVHKAKVKLMRVPTDQLYDLPGRATHDGDTTADDYIPGDSTAHEFTYQLLLIEDLDDDRVHTFEEGDKQPPGPFEDVANAGIRDVVPVHEISKVFYADTGKILNIGGDDDTNNPVLLLKRDVHADPPRRMMRRSGMSDYAPSPNETTNGNAGNGSTLDAQSEIDAQLHRESAPNTPLRDISPAPHTPQNKSQATNGDQVDPWRLPKDLDPEWMAFEVFTEAESDSDSDNDEPLQPTSSPPAVSREESPGIGLTASLSRLGLGSRSNSTNNSPLTNKSTQLVPIQQPSNPTTTPNFHRAENGYPQIKTTLSLLEMLLKLTALQQFRQESHLAIEDEFLNFFLEESATAGGAGGSHKESRQRVRREAVRTVGFDPYDESPVKMRKNAPAA